MTLDAGTFERVAIDPTTGVVSVTVSAATPFTPHARLRIEQPANVAGVGAYATTRTYPSERGAAVVPLGKTGTVIELRVK